MRPQDYEEECGPGQQSRQGGGDHETAQAPQHHHITRHI